MATDAKPFACAMWFKEFSPWSKLRTANRSPRRFAGERPDVTGRHELFPLIGFERGGSPKSDSTSCFLRGKAGR